MDKRIDLGTLCDVAYLTSGGRFTLVFTRVLRHPPERVWEALTDPEQMRAWSPFTANRSLSEVGPAVVSIVDGDLSEDADSIVTVAVKPRLLEVS